MKLFLCFFMTATVCIGQNLTQHQWKERAIIITTDSLDMDLAQEQYDLFKMLPKELIDRQMVLYYCIEDACTFYDGQSSVASSELKYIPSGFRVRLYGLDGQVKRESNQVENPIVYFSLIDRMPMRRNEMRKRIKNGGND